MRIVEQEAEQKLLTLASHLRGASEGYYCIYYHLSMLLEQHRGDYQIKIAINIISDLFKDYDGATFVCSNSDVVVIYKGVERKTIERAIFQVRYLFMDDPLAYDGDGSENEDFCSVYDLEYNWRDFFRICKDKSSDLQSTIANDNVTSLAVRGRRRPLNARLLTDVIDDSSQLDLSRALRSQPICAYKKDKKLKTVFDEIYFNISHIQQMLPYGIDLLSNRELFKHYASFLDAQILRLLQEGGSNAFASLPISININIDTLFTDNFSRFSSNLTRKQKSSIILEIKAHDVFEDTDHFIKARDIARHLGYKICLDGLNSFGFLQLDRKSLGFDLIKLKWQTDMLKASANTKQQIYNTVQKCSSSRIILCHCDSELAVSYGHQLGISLFQGRHMDNLINPFADIVN